MTTYFGTESAYLTALDSVVSRLEAAEQRIREAEAERLELLAEALDIAACESEHRVASIPSGEKGEIAYRCVRSEVATALHLSERTVERRMSQAYTLTQDYGATFRAFREAVISDQHTSVIIEAGTVIGTGDSPEVIARRAAYEAAVLEIAAVENPSRLRPIARRLAAQHAEQTIDERHSQARTHRRVYLVDGEDGMADLVAHLPAVKAHAIHDRLTRMSRKLAEHEALVQSEAAAVPGNEDPTAAPRRTRDELRADLLSDILLSGSPESIAASGPVGIGAIQAHVQVVVPITEMPQLSGKRPSLDPSEQVSPPAELAGFGPIDGATAQILAGGSQHWDTVRTHRASGQILSVDRYRPSEEMRRRLRARDQHCRFPGCRAPLARCDLDHTVDAQFGGATSTDNLAHLCRGHHTLKHQSGWHVTQGDAGDLTWRSPTGRHYSEKPPSKVRFQPVGSVTDGAVATDPDPPPF